MDFNTAGPPPETPEDEEPELEFILEIEIEEFVPDWETDLLDQILPDREALSEEYLQKEFERQKKQEQEELAKLLQDRIP